MFIRYFERIRFVERYRDFALTSTYCRENAPEVFCTHFNEELVVPVECCRAFVTEAEKHKMKVGACYYNLSREGQGHGIRIPEKLPEKELYPDISANIIQPYYQQETTAVNKPGETLIPIRLRHEIARGEWIQSPLNAAGRGL